MAADSRTAVADGPEATERSVTRSPSLYTAVLFAGSVYVKKEGRAVFSYKRTAEAKEKQLFIRGGGGGSQSQRKWRWPIGHRPTVCCYHRPGCTVPFL